MSIRGRLNQMQGRANGLMSKAEWTLNDAKELLAMGMDMLAMVEEGVSVGAVVEDGGIYKLARMIATGQGGELPIQLTLDPTYSHYPKAGLCEFKGGPFDGKTFKITGEQAKSKVIKLDGAQAEDPQPEFSYIYTWNGYEFELDQVDDDPEFLEEV